jgi:hypothetical protein
MLAKGASNFCKEMKKLLAPLALIYNIKFNMNLTFVYILFRYV